MDDEFIRSKKKACFVFRTSVYQMKSVLEENVLLDISKYTEFIHV